MRRWAGGEQRGPLRQRALSPPTPPLSPRRTHDIAHHSVQPSHHAPLPHPAPPSLAGTPLARANARAARTRAAQQRSCARVHRWCACGARTGAEGCETMQQWVDCGSLCLRMCQMYACMAVCWLFCAPICALRARSARAHLLCCGAPQCCFDGLRGRCTRLCCYCAAQCFILWLAVACSARTSGAIRQALRQPCCYSIIIFSQYM